MELDVREHAFLLASHSIEYSFVRIKGLANVLHGGSGMFMDRFVTAQYPGLLLLHGNGNVLERTLRPARRSWWSLAASSTRIPPCRCRRCSCRCGPGSWGGTPCTWPR